MEQQNKKQFVVYFDEKQKEDYMNLAKSMGLSLSSLVRLLLSNYSKQENSS